MKEKSVTGVNKQEKVSTITRLAYGSGDVACNIVFGMISTLLTLFYTDYVGISPAMVGMVMLVSRVFDGSSDVIMGILVNKTKSKWGKARPYILWMAVPYAISAVLLFCIPHTTPMVQAIYMFVTYNLATTVLYTAINVPYGTLSTLMTRSSHERDLLSIFRMAMSPFGKIIAVTFTLPLVKVFGNDQSAWIKVMSIWAVVAILLLVFCFVKCEEKVEVKVTQEQKIPFSKSIKALVSNIYFWATLGLWTVTCVHATIVGTDLPYYCKYILHNDDWMYSVLFTAEIIVMILGAMICPFLLNRWNKRNISLAGCILAVAAHVAFLLNPGSFSWALITSIVRAFGEAPLVALVFGMMGDVIEYGQWKNHMRQESLVFGGGSLGFKIGTGVTSALMTGMLTASGYVTSSQGTAVQPQSALDTILNLYKFGPIIVWAIAVVILVFYKLDEKIPMIMEELAEREAKGEL